MFMVFFVCGSHSDDVELISKVIYIYIDVYVQDGDKTDPSCPNSCIRWFLIIGHTACLYWISVSILPTSLKAYIVYTVVIF